MTAVKLVVMVVTVEMATETVVVMVGTVVKRW